MNQGMATNPMRGDGSSAVDRYLLLIDISGYTAFLSSVAATHGEDFSGGLPAGYRVLGELLEGVVDALSPDFDLVKLEGDAVFGASPAGRLDHRGSEVVEHLAELYVAFAARRFALRSAADDKCIACSAVEHLDLKMILHRGLAVSQRVAGTTDLHGPAVNVAHRLLKNSIRQRIGYRPYLLLTDAAADALDLRDRGLAHEETYPDVGRIDGRVLDLAEMTGVDAAQPRPDAISAAEWPDLVILA